MAEWAVRSVGGRAENGLSDWDWGSWWLEVAVTLLMWRRAPPSLPSVPGPAPPRTTSPVQRRCAHAQLQVCGPDTGASVL